MDILSYHVFSTYRGGVWLDDSEQAWTIHFSESAGFSTAELANDIGKRETARGPIKDSTFYVFACLGTMD